MTTTRSELLASDLLRTQLYYDGQWRDGSTGDRHPVTDPATGEEIAQVAISAWTRSAPCPRGRPAD